MTLLGQRKRFEATTTKVAVEWSGGAKYSRIRPEKGRGWNQRRVLSEISSVHARNDQNQLTSQYQDNWLARHLDIKITYELIVQKYYELTFRAKVESCFRGCNMYLVSYLISHKPYRNWQLHFSLHALIERFDYRFCHSAIHFRKLEKRDLWFHLCDCQSA